MDIKLIIDVLGWAAAIMILAAYYLISRQKVDNRSLLYHLLNLYGGIFFVVNLTYYKVWPLVVLNIFWVVVALIGIRKACMKS
jgi:hypothetical protein